MLATSRASVTARPAVLSRRAGSAAPRAVAAARPAVSISRTAAPADSSIPKPKVAALRPAAAPVAARRAVVAQAASDPLER